MRGGHRIRRVHACKSSPRPLRRLLYAVLLLVLGGYRKLLNISGCVERVREHHSGGEERTLLVQKVIRTIIVVVVLIIARIRSEEESLESRGIEEGSRWW